MASDEQVVKSQAVTKTAGEDQPAGKTKTVKKAAAKKPRIAVDDDGFIEAGAVAPRTQNTVLASREERGCRILRFGTSCTLHEAPALRTALLTQLEARAPLLLDASGIEAIDTAGVQMLVDLAIECMERGLAFHWKARSSAVEQAVGVLGVAALMESPGSVDQFAGLL